MRSLLYGACNAKRGFHTVARIAKKDVRMIGIVIKKTGQRFFSNGNMRGLG
jgi:hypothetical protein